MPGCLRVGRWMDSHVHKHMHSAYGTLNESPHFTCEKMEAFHVMTVEVMTMVRSHR